MYIKFCFLMPQKSYLYAFDNSITDCIIDVFEAEFLFLFFSKKETV